MSIKSISTISILSIIILFIGYGGIIIWLSWPIAFGNIDKAGVFGDSFGVLTSLFSGLAFAGIVLTILLQKDELGLQRDELKLTREEMKGQHETLKKQSFENTFFQMLKFHNDIVGSIDISGKSREIKGRDCFSIFRTRLNTNYTPTKDPTSTEETENIHLMYDAFWHQNQQDLGHYFRYLYTIFKFIKNSDIYDKKLYSNIVRAQLSDMELVLIFYNCLYKLGYEKFKPLVEEFSIFDNLPLNLLLRPEHKEFYKSDAFGIVATTSSNDSVPPHPGI